MGTSTSCPEDVALELLVPVKDGAPPVAEVAASLEDIAATLANLLPAEEAPVSAEGIQAVVLVASRSGYTPITSPSRPASRSA